MFNKYSKYYSLTRYLKILRQVMPLSQRLDRFIYVMAIFISKCKQLFFFDKTAYGTPKTVLCTIKTAINIQVICSTIIFMYILNATKNKGKKIILQ